MELKPDPGRLVAVDGGAVLLVSLGICFAGHALPFMTLLVPLVLLLRFLFVAMLTRNGEGSMKVELAFFLICTLLGAFNDWSSVCRKGIYDYAVPHYFSFSTIPLWMLLFWGMILRLVARMARWELLSPPTRPSNRVGRGALSFDHPVARIALLLALVVATRQSIYRLYEHPVWSWLPFLLALALYALLVGFDRHDLKLLGLFLVGGPLTEVLYIQVGGLHAYRLGWIGGVPLWIALWWLLAVLIWKDLSLRIEVTLQRWLGGRERSVPLPGPPPGEGG